VGFVALGPSLAMASEGGAAPPVAESEGAPETGPFFYKMDVLLLPVVEKRQIKRYAEVVVTLELATREHESIATKRAAVLRDRFLRDLQFQAGMRGEGDVALDLKRIKARFKVLANRVVGEGAVLDVLIDSAIDHGG
jgi:hypothetical protein